MRGASCRIIDALPGLGGQLMALYPEKFVFDVAGFRQVLAKDLVKGMAEQALQFGCEVHLDEVVTGLSKVDEPLGIGHFVLETDREAYPTRTLLIAAGIGAFEPRKLPADGVERWEGKGLEYKVFDPKAFAGRRGPLVGGGGSARSSRAGCPPTASGGGKARGSSTRSWIRRRSPAGGSSSWGAAIPRSTGW